MDDDAPAPSMPLPASLLCLAFTPWWSLESVPAALQEPCLLDEVREWCDEHLAAWSVECLPVPVWPGHKLRLPCMVFASEAEMVMFRLRWAWAVGA